MKACGGAIMTTAHDLKDSALGRCEKFEEKQVAAILAVLPWKFQSKAKGK